MSKTNPQNSDYHLSANGHFLVADFQNKKPFSNFLPGIAGLYGTPMWVFYVNRGQGVASFGTKNKDQAILEFFPANKAYQMTPLVGFRTFLKIDGEGTHKAFNFIEPFGDGRRSQTAAPSRTMKISSHELSLEEALRADNLSTEVVYFTVPDEPLAVLARCVTLTNLSRKPREIQVADGLPIMNPYGMNEFFMKNMSRTIEAWMTVENLEHRAPFYRLKVDATDRPEVEFIKEGNFFVSFVDDGKSIREADPIVDPARIFGARLDFVSPDQFLAEGDFDPRLPQITENKTPCAFACARLRLAPGQSVKLLSYYGQAKDSDALKRFCQQAAKRGYFEKKRQENHRLIESVKAPIFGITASETYDLYCGQTYLDNIMRGGLPVVFGGPKDRLVYHVYSRKHGDLERDYNRFLVEPTFFSQGDGNYRDVNQNRRHDVWFEPRVGDSNIKTFLSLVQLDGFNPLVVKGNALHFKKTDAAKRILRSFFPETKMGEIEKILSTPFNIGGLYSQLEHAGLITKERFEEFINALTPFLTAEQKSDHGEGYWVDHWTYNLDLIESYLAIYPEKLKALLFHSNDYSFHDSDHGVVPRDAKYVLHKKTALRQFKSVFASKEKKQLLESRARQPHLVRTRHGHGEIYRTTLFVKLLSLATNKVSSLDPSGRGIEMEADKPSWYDALNGLPGLFGSSLCETFELKRLAVFLIESLDQARLDRTDKIELPEELADFIQGLDRSLKKNFASRSAGKDLIFWDEASSLRENFRKKTFPGLSGKEKKLSIAFVRLFLEHIREKTEAGIESARDKKTGLYPTYFENEPTRFRAGRSKDGQSFKPVSFSQKVLPAFLEGPVHALKVEKDLERRRALLASVRESGLYDKKLQMYKVNAPMGSASMEIGRARVFSPGWLENESIWLHMEYKFLLELLKQGLPEEFFRDFRKTLVAFQPADRYGRSILENSSFIVSSAFPDANLHGTGFVARLSGSTAEFLNMWLLMNIGKHPFRVEGEGKVVLKFDPILPEFLFTHEKTARTQIGKEGRLEEVEIPKNCVAFRFLGKTLVVYHNPKRLNTFGSGKASVRKMVLSLPGGRKQEIGGDTVPSPQALLVRDGHVARIDIELG